MDAQECARAEAAGQALSRTPHSSIRRVTDLKKLLGSTVCSPWGGDGSLWLLYKDWRIVL